MYYHYYVNPVGNEIRENKQKKTPKNIIHKYKKFYIKTPIVKKKN